MSKKIYGIPVSTPINPAKIDPVVPEDKIASSVAAYMEENPITPIGIGARPDTWMPTAEEVGARPATWMPSASDVGARPDTWTPSAEDVGARPVNWMPTATDVGARPNTWMPSATDVGARPNTWLPTIAEIGAAPDDFGLGAHAGMTVSDANEATKNGWYLVQSGAANAANQYEHPMLVVGYGQTALTQIAFVGNTASSMTYILIRKRYGANWNEWEYLNPACSVGVEYRTTERWNGVAVYTQLLDYGTTTAEMTVWKDVPGITRLLRAVPNHNNSRCGDWNNSIHGFHQYNSLYFAFGMGENQDVVCYFKGGEWGVGKNLKAQIWYTKN